MKRTGLLGEAFRTVTLNPKNACARYGVCVVSDKPAFQPEAELPLHAYARSPTCRARYRALARLSSHTLRSFLALAVQLNAAARDIPSRLSSRLLESLFSTSNAVAAMSPAS